MLHMPQEQNGKRAPGDLVNQVISLYQKGDLQATLSQAQKLIQTYPKTPLLHNVLGVCLSHTGQPKQALFHFKESLKLNPSNPEIYNNLANILIDLKQYEEAQKLIEYAIKIKPDFAEAHNNLGTVLKKSGDSQSAIISYKKAISLKPDYSEAHLNLGIALKKNGAIEAAIESFKDAINYKPNFLDAYIYIGDIFEEKLYRNQEAEDLINATNSFKKALTINPNNFLAYDGLSSLLRYYTFARSNQLFDSLERIETLIKTEQQKLRAKVRRYSLWHVDVPKTSTTAINYLLGKKFGWPFGRNIFLKANGKPSEKVARSILFPDHTPAFISKYHIGTKLWRNIDTFAVSRNPYKWCSSLWFHTIKFNSLGLNVDSFDHFLGSVEEKLQCEFTKRLIFPSNYRQTDYLLDTSGKILVKHLFKLEDKVSIDKFLESKGVFGYRKTYMRQFGNETQSTEHKPTRSQMKRIEVIFQRDFEILGY